jgi:hypothetical protein
MHAVRRYLSHMSATRSQVRKSLALAAVLLGSSTGACTGSRVPTAGAASPTRVLPAVEQWRIDYALRSSALIRRRWTQFGGDDPCILLVGTEAQWVLNCVTAPEEFEATPQRFHDRTVFVRVGGQFLTSGRSLDTSDFIRAVPATIALPRPGQPKSALAQDRPFLLVSALDALKRLHPTVAADTPTEKWLSIFIHEYFHLLQYFDGSVGEPAQVDGSPLVQLYETDAEYRRMLEAEHALLEAEVARSDVDTARAAATLRDWNEAYQARRRYLIERTGGAELVRLDEVLCYVEGLARYVEAQYLVDPRYHLQDASAADPDFKNFSDFAGRGYAGMPNSGLSAEYYYALGMHIALLLDRRSPDWYRTVQTVPGYLVGAASLLANEQ